MTTFEVFKLQLDSMRAQLDDKVNDYIRMDVAGIEAIEIQSRQSPTGNTLLIRGFDEHAKEVVLVIPENLFYGKLSADKKSEAREAIGFNFTKETKPS